MATAAIPSTTKSKQLRACLLCSVIQSFQDFRKYGCPNCEEILQVRRQIIERVVVKRVEKGRDTNADASFALL